MTQFWKRFSLQSCLFFKFAWSFFLDWRKFLKLEGPFFWTMDGPECLPNLTEIKFFLMSSFKIKHQNVRQVLRKSNEREILSSFRNRNDFSFISQCVCVHKIVTPLIILRVLNPLKYCFFKYYYTLETVVAIFQLGFCCEICKSSPLILTHP